MHDEHDVGGVEQSLTDGERPDDVVGDNAAGVAQDVGVTFAKSQKQTR